MRQVGKRGGGETIIGASRLSLRALVRRWLGARSNGVRVRRATLISIIKGDLARQCLDWARAAEAYRAALAREPYLTHIWIQLGHCLKEDADFAGAEQAYLRAAELDDNDVEPLVRLGHMAASADDLTSAAWHFVNALRRSPEHLGASAELVRLLPQSTGVDAGLWREAVAVLGVDLETVAAEAAPPLAPGAVLIDLTDLLAYLSRARLPTGIQRVQIGVALACLEHAAGPVLLCCHLPARGGWVLLPRERFERLCRASLVSDDQEDAEWRMELRRLYLTIAAAAPVRYASGSVLINPGASWSNAAYFDHVRRERERVGLVYVPLVYDLIPMLRPDWFMPALVREYRRSFARLLPAADGFLAISHATRTDLIESARDGGHAIDPELVRVVRIDGDLRREEAVSLAADRLADWELAEGGFVLMVSTLEPRKNHLGAFEAWRRLIKDRGEAGVPVLACVGGRGWLNDDVHAMLARHPALRRRVRLISGASDDELALLYRACRFTLYPSFYEGWGLPVSESLQHDKVPAISNTSSLPEAGGAFACYFDPADPVAIAAAVISLLDDERLADREKAIRREYRPRSWRAIAAAMIDETRRIADQRTGSISAGDPAHMLDQDRASAA